MPVLGDLFSAADSVKRRVKASLADPPGWLEQAAEVVRDRGGRPTSAQQVADSLGSDAGTEEAMGWWNPGGPAGGLAGLIRQGGNRSLVGLHQMDLGKLGAWLENAKLPREIYSPSVALNRFDVPQDFGNLTMVMRPDALDPGSGRVAGKIWNRDSYTPRSGEFDGRFGHDIVQGVKDARAGSDEAAAYVQLLLGAVRRNRDKFTPRFDDMRMMEAQGGVGLGLEQSQAIMSSPTMRSFKEYENNPRGASLLTGAASPKLMAEQTTRRLYEELTRLASKGNTLAASFLSTRNAPSKMNRELADLLQYGGRTAVEAKMLQPLLRDWKKDLAYLPSQYGELKVTGPVRLDAPNWSGALVDEEYAQAVPEYTAKLKEILGGRGIPVMTSAREDLYRKAKMMSEQNRPVWGR